MPRQYGEPSGDPNLGDDSAQDLVALTQHIGEWWGEGMVWHEIVSEYVHIDVHSVPPKPEQPYHFLLTTGMSDRPMTAPNGRENFRYCELLLALPADWPLTQEAFKDERNYWPIRHLKQSARFPHTFKTWVTYGHTVANGNDLAPVAPGIPFVGFALSIPALTPKGSWSRRIRNGKEVHFFSLIPLYEDELKFAWEHGTGKLFERLDAAGVNEVVNITRPCVITGKRPSSVAPSASPSQPSLLDRLRTWWKG